MYSRLFSWGANIHYFHGSPTNHKISTCEDFNQQIYQHTVQQIGAVI